MKIQRVQINNKINHVFDYESDSEQIEKFIISATESQYISILKFHKAGDGAFVVDSERQSEKYSFKSAHLSKLDGQKIPSYQITIEFADYVSINENRNTENTNKTSGFLKAKNKTSAKSAEVSNGTLALDKIENDAFIQWHEGAEECIMDFSAKIMPKDPLMLRIEFKLPNRNAYGDEIKTKQIELYVSPREMIYDVILDFGSEASQMACYGRATTATVNGFSPLFPNIRGRYQNGDEEILDNKDFYQNDTSSDLFYRSYFMLKNSITNAELDCIVRDIRHESGGEFFRKLTSKRFVQENKSKYIVAPNVKIACFGGQEMPQIKVDEELTSLNMLGGNDSFILYRMGIYPFIVEAINSLVKVGNARFISFHILMPNVYLQVEISKILQLLQGDIARIIDSNEKFRSIWGFEVTAVSESDASIIGACRLMGTQNVEGQFMDGKYLLLDAGKGTLDLSLIDYKYDVNRNGYIYNNLWRSGIIGAGNSLSYAFLFELVHQFLEESAKLSNGVKEVDVETFIKENILMLNKGNESNPYYLLELMRLVDAFKVHYKNVRDVIEDDNNDKIPLKQLTLSGFTTWLEKRVDEVSGGVNVSIKSKGYIERMVTSIVNEVMNSLDDMDVIFKDRKCIDYVIFSGRAFNLSEFKDKMYKALEGRYEGIEEKRFIGDNLASSMKNICLLCATPLVNGNYDRKINSTVSLIDEKPINDSKKNLKENKRKKNRNKFLAALGLCVDNETSNEKVEFDDDSDLNKVGLTLFKKHELFGRSTEPSSFSSNEQTDLGYGIVINNPQCALINIGGVRFPFNETEVVLGDDKKIDILFNGVYHIVRSKNGAYPLLRPAINMKISPFMISSFFPYCTVNSNSFFKIPDVKRRGDNKKDETYNSNISQTDGSRFTDDKGSNKKRVVSESEKDATELDDFLNNK